MAAGQHRRCVAHPLRHLTPASHAHLPSPLRYLYSLPLAGDSARLRDAVLNAHALPGIVAHLNPAATLSFVRNATWTLSNFLRGRPPPDFAFVKQVLPVLAVLIYSEDVDVLTDGLWALSYLTDADEEIQLQAALEVRRRRERALVM